MDTQEVLDILKAELTPLLTELKAEVIDFSLKRRGPELVLSMLADKDGGITIDECALINNRIGDIVDSKNIIAERYTIEVSSPGLDRPLKAKRDFERLTGGIIEVWLLAPVEGKNFLTARIKRADETAVLVEDKNLKEFVIPYGAINKARLKID
jgi:ribosome maturation factor RimP